MQQNAMIAYLFLFCLFIVHSFFRSFFFPPPFLFFSPSPTPPPHHHLFALRVIINNTTKTRLGEDCLASVSMFVFLSTSTVGASPLSSCSLLKYQLASQYSQRRLQSPQQMYPIEVLVNQVVLKDKDPPFSAAYGGTSQICFTPRKCPVLSAVVAY